MTNEERFWAKVQTADDDACWEWTGAKDSDGYGHFLSPSVRAPRFAYEIAVGPIPEGLVIDHICENRGCVNPKHLRPLTVRENTMRSKTAPSAVNARKTHCDHGHEFTEENTLWVRKNVGHPQKYRQCRTCHRLRQRAKSERIRNLEALAVAAEPVAEFTNVVGDTPWIYVPRREIGALAAALRAVRDGK